MKNALVAVAEAFAWLVIAFLCVLALLGCIHGARAIMPVRGDDPAAITVKIWHPCGWFGSGVIVDEKHVITARHVALTACDLKGADPVLLITDAQGRTYLAEVEYLAYRDLARLVLITDHFTPTFKPRIKGVRPGQKVCVESGAPSRSRSCGYVERVDSDTMGGVVSSAKVKPGNSGSGLWRGTELVGIVIACRSTKDACNDRGGFATALVGREWILAP